MLRLWLKRLLATQLWRVLGAAAGIGLAAALLGTLGAFLSASYATMTDRAIAGVPVDWQVQLGPSANVAQVRKILAADVQPDRMERVSYADVAGFASASRGVERSTGPGQVVGLDDSYARSFPTVVRPLIGSASGVLLAQQTASNLDAHVGDRVEVLLEEIARGSRTRVRRVSTRVAGIIDLPFADSFFQVVGVAPARAPQAPPDNVLIIPSRLFQHWLARQAERRPQSVRTQLHVRLTHHLPHDPLAAMTAVIDSANRFELKTAGAAIVADNLAAQLQGTREDALYARLLFLFLGLPGAALAAIVALVIVAAGRERWRRDAALLRVRGATAADITLLATVEAVLVWVIAAVIAAVVIAIAGIVLRTGVGITDTAPLWGGIGLGVAALIVAINHFALVSTANSIARDLNVVGRSKAPVWRTMYLDLILLAVGAAFFANTAASGFQVVLAPEGVLQSSVSYDAFIGPFFLWLGGGLFVRRLADMWLSHRPLFVRTCRPLAGNLAGIVAAAISRQRANTGRGLTIVALAIAFAVSTALFNETYDAQARVDAELTNGADVAVVLPNTRAGDAAARRLAKSPGVAGIDVMQHRFAYVGQDLQDLFAIDPLTIGKATDMSDAFFGSHDARATLSRLASQPDGALLAAETVSDFQLHEGDRINLRLQTGAGGTYRTVPFTFVGAVREFPTAPRDSFIVANSSYIRTTGVAGSRIVLMRALAGRTTQLAVAARSVVGGLAGARVSDIASAQRSVGSSLTSVDLHGLTAVELAFALLLLVGASGLSLALGFAERRRNFAVLAALGATPGQLGSFLWAEAGVEVAGGAIAGAVLGLVIAHVLVKVLTGVFDPPPDALDVPWLYLGALAAVAAVATTIVVLWARSTSISIDVLRSDRP
ncbi:MAG TPA: ABC transporter permease [Candidatus Eremiobacteraceae bacterium]|nr:ABC transporter permease [Candidatus Eremiobacteraceae bacterium]